MGPQTTVGRQHFWIILFLGTLNALTPFTIDLYLPAFADIAADLGTTVPKVSLSVATYFVGFALGQIIYGPLLDRFGRKNPIYVGLTLYILASVGCMTAGTVEALWIFRFLSALGGSAASVGTITMVRDYFDPKEGAKVFSMLMLVLSVSPLFAPSIGAWLAAYYGWRAIFGLLAVMAVVDVALVVFGLPKVYEADRSVELRPGPIFRTFGTILKIRQFRTYATAGALSFAGLFVYITGSAAIFIDHFGVSKSTFGLIFAIVATAMIGGGQINNFLMKKWDSSYIYPRAIGMQIVLSLIFLISVLTWQPGLVASVAFFVVILLPTGIGYPNAAALALKPIQTNIGSASSLLGFIQMGLGAAVASVVGIIEVSGMLPTSIALALSSVLAGLVLFLGAIRR
jgi:MFS transporter, DHA1 family, multidrug resistance protein